MNDFEGAIDNYKKYISFEGKDELTNIAQNRISAIEESILIEEKLVLQKINYSKAIKNYFSGAAIDSVILILDLVLDGRNSIYKTSAQRLKSAFSDINNFNIFMLPDSSGQIDSLIQSQMDSIYYNLGDIFDYNLGLSDSAQYYYQKILNEFENSNFRYESMLAMNKLEPDGVWKTLITLEFPDSSILSDSNRMVEGIIFDSLNEDFIEMQNDFLTSLDQASESFIEVKIDSLSLENISDSTIVEFTMSELPNSENILPGIIDSIDLNKASIISHLGSDTSWKDLSDTSFNQLISNDITRVVQPPILELPIDSTWAEYIILYGESLRSISQKEYGSEEYWSLIYDWNKEILNDDPGLVFPYQILKLRKPGIYEIEIDNEELYIVSEGETLWSIAQSIYQDEYAWSILLQDNKEKLENPDKIYPGYSLSIRVQLLELKDEN